MTDDRSEFQAARTAGLAKRQERRLVHARGPLDETLARIGRDMAQQTMAAEGHKRQGLDDRHHYHEYHRFQQGRWAFYESARLICQYFGRDFEAWLTEWRPEA